MNILIVGGTSGIGKALVTLAEAEGHVVYQASRKAEGERSATLDVAGKYTFPEGFIPAELHGLVYCPGTINLKPLTRITPEQMLEDYAINVVGAFQAVQACQRQLKAGQGSVVLFSTVAAKVGMPFHASIAAAKAGLEGMARSLAAEMAQAKVRVNVIAPSLTDTPLAGSLLDSPEKVEASGKRHPLGRVGTMEEMAQAAMFLLSPAAGWITGQTLGIDGGMGNLR
jgi:3-oxoacyl-[acyl-carrier protein] reductase